MPTIDHRSRCLMVGTLALCPPYGTLTAPLGSSGTPAASRRSRSCACRSGLRWRASASSSASAGFAIADRRQQPFRRPARRDLIGKNADAVAALLRIGRAGKCHRARAIGPRPRVRDQRERHFVNTGPEFDAKLLAVPERGGVADRRQRERARELERVAFVPRVPVGEADIAADGLAPCPGRRWPRSASATSASTP